jgi:predicted nucleic acid-binding Zn ribbon protein
MANYYCEYYGQKNTTVHGLTAGNCIRHPNGNSKRKHKLYEGTEKSQYVCKLCGIKNSTLHGLTSGNCIRHPNGNSKGKYQPEL